MSYLEDPPYRETPPDNSALLREIDRLKTQVEAYRAAREDQMTRRRKVLVGWGVLQAAMTAIAYIITVAIQVYHPGDFGVTTYSLSMHPMLLVVLAALNAGVIGLGLLCEGSS